MAGWQIGLLLGVWVVWWLWAVDWRKCWPVLASGGWVPLLLLAAVLAGAWSRVDEGNLPVGDWFAVPNFLWKLIVAGGLLGLALIAGWLQGLLGWAPPEIVVEPPPAHDHGHGHAEHH